MCSHQLPCIFFNACAFAVLGLDGLFGSHFWEFFVAPLVMAGTENEACELQLAHDLSSSVNTKQRVYSQMTESRCCGNLSDIAGLLCIQIFPSCGKNYLTLLFTPILPPPAEEPSVASCGRRDYTENKGMRQEFPAPDSVLSQPRPWTSVTASLVSQSSYPVKNYQPTRNPVIFDADF